MARKPTRPEGGGLPFSISAVDEMLLDAMHRGDESLETGRYIVTYREDAAERTEEHLKSLGLRTADARDFTDQAVSAEDVGDADALFFPEIGAAVISADASQERDLSFASAEETDEAVEAIEPEYFAFADQQNDYLRGFKRAIDAISADLAELDEGELDGEGVDAQVSGATWGMTACRVPWSLKSGAGVRVAVLDTGMALTHPDFQGRQIVSQSFVGQPVDDLHGHGTHCIGTSCGPRAPVGSTPRYGAAFQGLIYAGKVLSNSGSGATGGVLAGMNWAIANRCAVISMSLGSQSPPQTAYTAAGRAALANNCLIIAAAGNAASQTGAPANSPSIMAVASIQQVRAGRRTSRYSACRAHEGRRRVAPSPPSRTSCAIADCKSKPFSPKSAASSYWLTTGTCRHCRTLPESLLLKKKATWTSARPTIPVAGKAPPDLPSSEWEPAGQATVDGRCAISSRSSPPS